MFRAIEAVNRLGYRLYRQYGWYRRISDNLAGYTPREYLWLTGLVIVLGVTCGAVGVLHVITRLGG